MPSKRRKCCFADAKENPWELFTVEELATIHGVSPDAIESCKRNGAHFVFNMSRPEWIIEFLRRPKSLNIQCKTILPKQLDVLPRADSK